jgi:hypothetical protein
LSIDLPAKSEASYASFDFSQLPAGDQVDAIVHVVGRPGLERRRITDHKLTICRDNPDENIDEINLVISNPSLTPTPGPDTVDLRYRTAASCAGGVTGTINFQTSGSAHDHVDYGNGWYSDTTQSVNSTGQLKLDVPDPSNHANNRSTSSLSGTSNETSVTVYPGLGGTFTADGTWNGDQKGIHAASVNVVGTGSDRVVQVIAQLKAPGTVYSHTDPAGQYCDAGSEPIHPYWNASWEVPLDKHGDGSLDISADFGTPEYQGGLQSYHGNCGATAIDSGQITGTILVRGVK